MNRSRRTGGARAGLRLPVGRPPRPSDDSRYLLPSTAADRCRVTSDERLPETLDAWLSAAGADEQIYAKAACRVSRWADRHGGPQAVLDLIDSLNRGEPFTATVSD